MVADYVNSANHLTFDLGQVIFGPAMTMTADGPVEYVNAKMLPKNGATRTSNWKMLPELYPYSIHQRAL